LAFDVDATRITGRWLKHAYLGAAPLAPRDPPPDNRWQRGDVVDAIYLADEEATAWAEWYRHLAERGVPPNAQMPRELWAWAVDVAVADGSDRRAAGAADRYDDVAARAGRSPRNGQTRKVSELHLDRAGQAVVHTA
jgi:RES domain-containing protein